MKSNWKVATAIAPVAGRIVLLANLCLFAPVASLYAAGPNLSGTVRSQTGQVLRDASVFIYTAGPKEGAGILCPSCYADCRKRTTSDAAGGFTIEDLDPTLLFRILVVAKGHQPEFVSKVDPALKPLEVALKSESGGDSPDKRLRGRVLDSEARAVSGAVVTIRGVTRGLSTRFGGNDDIDPVAVTDQAGEFVIHGRTAFDAAGVDVEARALAKGVFQHLKTGDMVHTIRLTEGVSAKGRVLRDGKPVAGVEIGICGADRNAETYVGDFSVATDREGCFLFANLPPRTRYYVYGLMKSLGEKGALAARSVSARDDGSTLEIGDLKLQPAFVIAGQMRLTDSKSVPPKTRVLLGREEAWDTLQVEADAQGRFRFVGVPPETVHLSARIAGYRLSPRNGSFDPSRPFGMAGRVKADKTDLLLELEPGDRHEPMRAQMAGLRDEPLRGAEAAANPSGDIKVTGTVTDADSGKPVSSFTVTEGRADPVRSDYEWLPMRKTAHTNGAFTVYFMKLRQTPGVLIEADGYLPQSSGAILTAATNLTIALKKGSGPAGVLLQPDDKPAANVKVYLADMRDGVYVDNSKMAPREGIYRQTRSTRTDAAGRFSFTPGIGDYSILALDDAGYAEVTVQALAAKPEVRLQPWARVEGQLMIGAKPGTNETVRLGSANLPYENHPRMISPLSIFLTTRTDGEGKFVFERVPPIHAEIYHEPRVRDSQTGIIPQSQTIRLTLAPGKTNQVTLGGKGRPVIGRLTVNAYEGQIDWRADVQSIERVLAEPPELPDMRSLSKEYGEASRAARTDAEKETARAAFERRREEMLNRTKSFYASEAGRQYHFARRRYVLNFSPDGTFRIEDVPGGKYTLRVDLRESGGDGPARFSAPKIADLQKEFEVPDSPGGRTDEPFDLGTIALQARVVMKPGKAAPEFEVKTLEDKTIRLSDYKGKYVLLDFWAVWCGPCVAETPHLKEAYEAFKDDPRFAMMGLSLDPDASAPRDYARKNGLGWTQGFLGEWSKSDVPSRFGVEGIPAIFLIGPDGKVVATDLRGPAIKSALQSALGNR